MREKIIKHLSVEWGTTLVEGRPWASIYYKGELISRCEWKAKGYGFGDWELLVTTPKESK